MRIKFITGFFAIVTLAFLPSTSLAEESFHVHYRVENLNQDAHNLAGTLYLNVYNTSGEDAVDLVARISEPNQVIYDQRQIILGTVLDGEQVEVLDQFIVPLESTQSEPTGEPVIWHIEYTCGLGDRHSVDVVGQKVP